MRGRPKGSIKSNKKKLKTFRLSDYELSIIKNTLNVLRNKDNKQLTDSFFITDKVKFLLSQNLTHLNDDISDVKHLFVIILHPQETYIAKCPIINQTQRSFFIKTFTSSGTIVKKQINKADIDKHLYFTTYELAFANHLIMHQYKIINQLLDYPEHYYIFLEIMQKNIFNALEYGAKILSIDNIFKLEIIECEQI